MSTDTTHATHMSMYHERARREREMEAENAKLKAALKEVKSLAADYMTSEHSYPSCVQELELLVTRVHAEAAIALRVEGERARKALGGGE